jgi:hypothetical protein
MVDTGHTPGRHEKIAMHNAIHSANPWSLHMNQGGAHDPHTYGFLSAISDGHTLVLELPPVYGCLSTGVMESNTGTRKRHLG